MRKRLCVLISVVLLLVPMDFAYAAPVSFDSLGSTSCTVVGDPNGRAEYINDFLQERGFTCPSGGNHDMLSCGLFGTAYVDGSAYMTGVPWQCTHCYWFMLTEGDMYYINGSWIMDPIGKWAAYQEQEWLGTMSYVLYPSMYGETSSTSLPGHTFRAS